MPRNEAETRADLIDPVLYDLGWGRVEGTHISREYQIAPGRILGGRRREKATIADYVLWYRTRKVAVIEAKAETKELTEGLGQAKEYARKLDVRYSYAANGLGFYQVDMETGAEGEIVSFPTPEEIWINLFAEENPEKARLTDVPFESVGGSFAGRYYQDSAVEAVLSAVADGRKRILLTLATGTGKTFIAFQISWKLFHAKWNISGQPTRRPRVLFLADRTTLANQAFNNFTAFPDDALVRITPAQIRKKGSVPKNGSIFFTIFQTFMTGADTDGNPRPYFGEYPPDYFDFVVVDECHRGGADDESQWRAILEYFSPAVQLGLTATPRRDENIDTYRYFGEPVYVYSLKDGINDGFLTPFRVRQISTTLDEYIWTQDDAVVAGQINEGHKYVEADFNRVIEIREREKKRVEIFMNLINQNEKTLVFCANQAHALLVRDLINQIKASTDPNFCVRVTADDGEMGEQYLRDFQDNERAIPTILTTSRKLSTGVDARNVRNIILMRQILTMIEFKQIIGRGTRLYEDKEYFTIYDFVKAHEMFADPSWDGDPVEPDSPTSSTLQKPPELDMAGTLTPEAPDKLEKIRVKLADGKVREIDYMMSTTFWNQDGQQVTARQFLEQLFGQLPDFFTNEAELRRLWSSPDTRQQLLEGLAERGFASHQLQEMQKLISAEKSDLFDVLAYVRFALPTHTRSERAVNARTYLGSTIPDRQRVFIDFVLDQYVEEGVEELGTDKLPPLLELRYGGVPDALDELGIDAGALRQLFAGFQQYLYLAPAS
jgi:type I restriction enzyme R subunit